MAVVCISRLFGAGGKTLGDRVAKRLGYRFVDRGIISKVAKEANVSIDWVVAVERETGGRLMQILSKVVSGDFMERHLQLSDSSADFDEAKYLAFIRKVITDIAAEGRVVILGRGAQYILPDDPGIFKFFLVASLKRRINFLKEQYQLTTRQAEELVDREEKKRASFLAKLDPRNENDPSAYHLCINMDLVSLEQAEDIVVDLVKHYSPDQK